MPWLGPFPRADHTQRPSFRMSLGGERAGLRHRALPGENMATRVLRGSLALYSRRAPLLSIGRHPPACRLKSSMQYLVRQDLPKLAYQKLKGKNPGVIFLPGYASDMNGQKALALEDFCKSLGHSFIRFDYTGCGSSEGDMKTCTIGKWKKDALSVLDEVSEGPQILVGSSMGGWLMFLAALARPEKIAALVGVAPAADHFVTAFNQLPSEEKKTVEEKLELKLPSKYSETGFYSIPYSFIKEAENHCLLNSPIPITCPVRLIHGMKDEDVPWHVSMQIADRILSTDVDVILRKHGQHRMSEKDDIKLLVYTIDDLIDKLTTCA